MSTLISKFHSMRKGSIEYPSVCIDSEYPEELPVIMDSLESGSLPVLIESDGELIMLEKKIRKSPINLEKIIRLYPILIILSEDRTVSIKTVAELLDVEGFDWTQ